MDELYFGDDDFDTDFVGLFDEDDEDTLNSFGSLFSSARQESEIDLKDLNSSFKNFGK